jgi:hypothetical protein
MVATLKINSETSRIRAALVNSGRFTFDTAERKLENSTLSICVGRESGVTPAGQAAALTAVLTASRCFLGGVMFSGTHDFPLILPLPLPAKTLGEAALMLGATVKLENKPRRTIIIGSGEQKQAGWSVRAIWNGWSAGIIPGEQSFGAIGRSDSSLAGIAAGALAVGHAFFAEQDDPIAGRIMQGLSLWIPDDRDQWMSNPGPEKFYVPNALWMVGMGNLGQAYLWALSSLPYSDPNSLELFFQDDDIIAEENWGTSILVTRQKYGILKTRLSEEWAECRKFRVRRVDRRLDQYLRRTPQEPDIAMAGLDKMAARRLLGLPGFEYIIDGGLGATVHDFHKFRLNIFDQSHGPATHFSGMDDSRNIKELLDLPAYRELETEKKIDSCGMAELAGQSIAVPFVSAFLASLAVTQAIRLASNQDFYYSITGDLKDLRSIRTLIGPKSDRSVVGFSETTHFKGL